MESNEQRARSYNRAKRYVSLADFLLGLLWMVLLLTAGWSAAFRDFAWSWTGRYWLALAIYSLLEGRRWDCRWIITAALRWSTATSSPG